MTAPHVKVQVSLLGQAKCCNRKLVAGAVWTFLWLNTLNVNFLVSIGVTSGVWRADFHVGTQRLRLLPSCGASMFSLCAPWNGMRMGYIPWSWPGGDMQHNQVLIIWSHPSCKGVPGNVDSWLSTSLLSSACHFCLSVCLSQNVAVWVKNAK